MAPKTHPNDDPTKTDTITPPQDSTSLSSEDSTPPADQEEAVTS